MGFKSRTGMGLPIEIQEIAEEGPSFHYLQLGEYIYGCFKTQRGMALFTDKKIVIEEIHNDMQHKSVSFIPISAIRAIHVLEPTIGDFYDIQVQTEVETVDFSVSKKLKIQDRIEMLIDRAISKI